MNARPNNFNHFTPRRGTALVEMVMVLPFLAFMVGMIFFFGWAMANQQEVRVADRYLAWRNAYNSEFANQNNTTIPTPAADPNQAFFNGQAVLTGSDTSGGGNAVAQSYLDRVSQSNQSAATILDSLLFGNSQDSAFLRGYVCSLDARFTSSINLWNSFQGSIAGAHGRDGLEWRYQQLNVGPKPGNVGGPLIDLYFADLESLQASIPADAQTSTTTQPVITSTPQDMVDRVIKDLYRRGW